METMEQAHNRLADYLANEQYRRNFHELSEKAKSILEARIKTEYYFSEKNSQIVIFTILKTTPTDGCVRDAVMNGESQYDLQNKLEETDNFPSFIYILDKKLNPDIEGVKGDERGSVYLDRVSYETSKQVYSVNKTDGILKAAAILNDNQPVNGARLVRYTNVSSGYPLHRVDYAIKSEDTPSWTRAQSEKNESQFVNFHILYER